MDVAGYSLAQHLAWDGLPVEPTDNGPTSDISSVCLCACNCDLYSPPTFCSLQPRHTPYSPPFAHLELTLPLPALER